jgi:hypothetical protein
VRKSKPARKKEPTWEIRRLKATPAAFIGLVDAPDETSGQSRDQAIRRPAAGSKEPDRRATPVIARLKLKVARDGRVQI